MTGTDPERSDGSPSSTSPSSRPPSPPPVLADHVPAVAAEAGVDGASLRALAGRLQASVADYPGVSDLVFEYRRAFSHDPLVARADGVYFLLVPPRVWPEFGAALDASDTELAALEAVHGRAFDAGTDVRERGDWKPLVLVG